MKRMLVIVLASLTMMAGLVGTATPAQAARVRCTIPSNYRVVCFNNTPWLVVVRLKIYTPSGLYVRQFRMPYTRKTIYSPDYVNRITWRWWFV